MLMFQVISSLIEATRRAYPGVEYRHCSDAFLAEIAQQRGIDFATALFYDRIRRDHTNRHFVDAIETPHAPAPNLRGTVLIAPALFYRERPGMGGDGAVVQQAAREAGLDVEVLPVRSGGTARNNGALIRAALARRCDDPTVLVSLSKGAADARLALESIGPLPSGLRAWVIVSGLLRGTPAIDRMRARWWSRAALRFIIARAGGSSELPAEFSRAAGAPLTRGVVVPRGLLVISLVGCPMTQHLTTRFGRMRHRQMSSLGPNDGLTLLRDAIVEPGYTYPVWGADHYFRSPGVPPLLRRILAYLGTAGCLESVNAIRRSG